MHNETRKSIGETNPLNRLHLRVDKYTFNDRQIFIATFIGGLSVTADPKAWDEALESAENYMQSRKEPEPLYANEKQQDWAVRRMDEGQ
jgi:hypothetical protein